MTQDEYNKLPDDEKKLFELILERDDAWRMVRDPILQGSEEGHRFVVEKIEKSEAAILDHYRKSRRG